MSPPPSARLQNCSVFTRLLGVGDSGRLITDNNNNVTRVRLGNLFSQIFRLYPHKKTVIEMETVLFFYGHGVNRICLAEVIFKIVDRLLMWHLDDRYMFSFLRERVTAVPLGNQPMSSNRQIKVFSVQYIP